MRKPTALGTPARQGQSFAGWRTNTKLPRLTGADTVHAFPLHQIYLSPAGTFIQARSGPNWLGGVATLTTCKHYMRLAATPAQWVGKWVAAFTPRATTGDSYLLLLAQVQAAYSSNYELGLWLRAHAPHAYKAKLAVDDPRGDIYSPRTTVLTAARVHDPAAYAVPHGHVRMELKAGVPKWHSDVAYTRTRGGVAVYPACLLLTQVLLCTKPKYVAVRPLYRSGYKCTGAEFVDQQCLRLVE
jgi:hypothetical protein